MKSAAIRYIALVALLTACAGELWAQSAESQREMLRKIAAPELAEGASELIFDSHTYSLGEISEDDPLVWGEFEFENQSPAPLLLTRVTTSCSCVEVEYTKKPVEVGAKAKIRFSYNPKGYLGVISRRITLYTTLSQSDPTAILRVEGYAEPSSDYSARFPYAFGDLHLRQKSVTFSGDRSKQVERIVAINGGESILKLGAMPLHLPAGLSFWAEPQEVAPGAEVDLVFSLDRELLQGRGDSYPVIIGGLNTPPSQRTVYINIK